MRNARRLSTLLIILHTFLHAGVLQCDRQQNASNEEQQQWRSNCSCQTDKPVVLSHPTILNDSSASVVSLVIDIEDNVSGLLFEGDKNFTYDGEQINASLVSGRRLSVGQILMQLDNATGPDTSNASNITMSTLTSILASVVSLTNASNSTQSILDDLNASVTCDCEVGMIQVFSNASAVLRTFPNTSGLHDITIDLLTNESDGMNTSRSSNDSVMNMQFSDVEPLDSNGSNTSQIAWGSNDFTNLSSTSSTTGSTTSSFLATPRSSTTLTTSLTADNMLQAITYVYGQLVLEFNISEGGVVNFDDLLIDSSFRRTARQSIADGLPEVSLDAVEVLQVTSGRRLEEVRTGSEDMLELRVAFRIRMRSSNEDSGADAIARKLTETSFASAMFKSLEADDAFLELLARQGATASLVSVALENVEIVTLSQYSTAPPSTFTMTSMEAPAIVTSTTSTTLWLVPTSFEPEPETVIEEDSEKTWRMLEILPLSLTLLAGILLPCSLSSMVEEATSPSRMLSRQCTRRVSWLRAHTGLHATTSSSARTSLVMGSQQRTDGGHVPILGQPTSRCSGAPIQWHATSQAAKAAALSPTWNVCQHGEQLLIEAADAAYRDGPAAVLVPTAWNEWRSLAGNVHVRYMTPTRLRVLRYDRKRQSQHHGKSIDAAKQTPASVPGLALSPAALTSSMPSRALPSATPPSNKLRAPDGLASAVQATARFPSHGQQKPRRDNHRKQPSEGTLRSLAKAASWDLLLALDLSPLIQHLLSVLGVLQLLAAGGALVFGTFRRLDAAGLLAGGVLCLPGLLTCLLGQCRSPQKLAFSSSSARFAMTPMPALCSAAALFVVAVMDEPRQAVGDINVDIIGFTTGAAGLVSALCALAFLLFESDCLGFFFVCVLHVMVGMTSCAALGVGGWSEDQAGRLASLLLLIVVTIGHLTAAFALHPYMQPLRAPSMPSLAEASKTGALDVNFRRPPSAPMVLPVSQPATVSTAGLLPPKLPMQGQGRPAPPQEPARWHHFDPPASQCLSADLEAASSPPPQRAASSAKGLARRLCKELAPRHDTCSVDPVRANVRGFYTHSLESTSSFPEARSFAQERFGWPDSHLLVASPSPGGWPQERLEWPHSHFLVASPSPGGRFICWSWCSNSPGNVQEDALTEGAASGIFPGGWPSLPDLRAAATEFVPPPPSAAHPQAQARATEEAMTRSEAEVKFKEEEKEEEEEEEEARLKVEEHLKAEKEARFKAEERARLEVLDKMKDLEEARLKVEEELEAEKEARFKSEERARLEVLDKMKDVEEARWKVEEELKAEKEARFRAEERARLEILDKMKDVEEARWKVEEELKAEKEARFRAEEKTRLEILDKLKDEEESRLKVEDELKAEKEARFQADERARLEVEERARLEAMIRSEAEAKFKPEEQVRLKVADSEKLRDEAEAEEAERSKRAKQRAAHLDDAFRGLESACNDTPRTLQGDAAEERNLQAAQEETRPIFDFEESMHKRARDELTPKAEQEAWWTPKRGTSRLDAEEDLLLGVVRETMLNVFGMVQAESEQKEQREARLRVEEDATLRAEEEAQPSGGNASMEEAMLEALQKMSMDSDEEASEKKENAPWEREEARLEQEAEEWLKIDKEGLLKSELQSTLKIEEEARLLKAQEEARSKVQVEIQLKEDEEAVLAVDVCAQHSAELTVDEEATMFLAEREARLKAEDAKAQAREARLNEEDETQLRCRQEVQFESEQQAQLMATPLTGSEEGSNMDAYHREQDAADMPEEDVQLKAGAMPLVIDEETESQAEEATQFKDNRNTTLEGLEMTPAYGTEQAPEQLTQPTSENNDGSSFAALATCGQTSATPEWTPSKDLTPGVGTRLTSTAKGGSGGSSALEIDIFSEPGEEEASVMDSPWGVSDRQFNARFQQPMRFTLSPTGSSTSGRMSGREVLGSFVASSSWQRPSSVRSEFSEPRDSDFGFSARDSDFGLSARGSDFALSARDSDFGLSERQLAQVIASDSLQSSTDTSLPSPSVGGETSAPSSVTAAAPHRSLWQICEHVEADSSSRQAVSADAEEVQEEPEVSARSWYEEGRAVARSCDDTADEWQASEDNQMQSAAFGTIAVDML